MYDLSVPVFLRGLEVASAYLDIAAKDAQARKIDDNVFLHARLAPDMMDLSQQIQRLSDTAKSGAARLAGVEAPSFEDKETSFAELKQRIDKTATFLSTITQAQLEGSESRSIKIKSGLLPASMTGREYLLTFLIPNFCFHLTTLHAILRHNGVAVGKKDFLGDFE
jgi:hypothetical protein